MLMRPLKVPPSLLLIIAFCVFLAIHFSPISLPTQPSPGPSSERKAPRIALVTFVTEERSYLHLALKSKNHYCRRHGYDFIVDYEAHAERGTPWWKHAMLERLIKKGTYDWVWWLDVDTLITNTEIKLTDIIDQTLENVTNPEEIDWLITHDCNGLNTGSYLVRGHERSIKLFDNSGVIYDKEAKKDNHLSDQDALGRLFKEDSASARRTARVPQWKLNAFPQEIACFDEDKKVWEHGFFVLHFAGAWAHVKGEDPTGQLMRKYQHEIIWGDYNQFA